MIMSGGAIIPCRETRKGEWAALPVVFFAIICFASSIARAQDLTIYAEDAAPINFERGGQITGSSTQIVMEILQRIGIDTPITIVPWARGFQIALTQPNIVLFSVARSAEREALFHWVGPLAEVQNAFYVVRNSNVSIQTIDDARSVESIGIRRADVRETYLNSIGFTNLERTNSNQSNLRKLIDGRIQLWATSDIEVRGVPEQCGIDPSAIRHAYTFNKLRLYIVISKPTPVAVVRKWQNTLNEMKRDGTFMTISRRWLPESSLPEVVVRPSKTSVTGD